METVLGLSVTSSSVGWVVLDGSGADAASLDHDVFDVAGRPAEDISRHIGAVRGAQAIATASGQHLKSIGVTWTDDAAATARLVLRALPGLGFDKVLPVRLAEVGEDTDLTLARGAALAVTSNAQTVAVPHREPVAVAPMHKHSWFGPPTRAAAVLVAGLSALFVVGPELAGQPESLSREIQPASDSPATSENVHAVPAPAAAPPVAEAIELVVGHPAPAPRRPTAPPPVQENAPMTAYVVEEAAPPVADVGAPDAPVTAEPVAVPQVPVQQVAAPSPAMTPPDPAQIVFSPLLSGLP